MCRYKDLQRFPTGENQPAYGTISSSPGSRHGSAGRWSSRAVRCEASRGRDSLSGRLLMEHLHLGEVSGVVAGLSTPIARRGIPFCTAASEPKEGRPFFLHPLGHRRAGETAKGRWKPSPPGGTQRSEAFPLPRRDSDRTNLTDPFKLVIRIECDSWPSHPEEVYVSLENQLVAGNAEDALKGDERMSHVIENPQIQDEVELAYPIRREIEHIYLTVFNS